MDEILDTEMLDELVHSVGGGDSSILKDVTGMFLDLGPEKLKELRDGLADHDADAIINAAHSLKGCAGTLGVRRLQADCGKIESIAGDALREDELSSLIEMADGHLTEGIEALQQLLKTV